LIYISVPVHDEEQTVGVLLWKVRKVMAEFGRDYEILVLDDASTDETPRILDRYRQILPLEVIRSDRRLGHGAAVARLLEVASDRTRYPRRDVAVTLQADFTEDPSALVDMVKAVEGGADLVTGTVDAGELPFRYRLARTLARLVARRAVRSAPVSDPLSPFRAYRIIVLRKALREVEEGGRLVSSDGWAANLELLARTLPHARRVEEVPYRMRFEHRRRPSRFDPWSQLRSLFRLRKVAWPLVAAIFVALGALGLPSPAPGQERSPWSNAVEDRVVPVPFGPGERAEYQVRLGPVAVGEGHMEVHGVERVRGFPTYRLSMGINGGVPLARVNNLYQSWLDVESLASRRFIQSQREVRFRRFRHFEFYPEERRWERADVEEEGDLPTDLPLDDIAFVYYVRSLPLEVGETYTLDRYFQEDGNPVIIEVLRRDRVTVPAGTFNTIVVRPVIRTRGLFSEGGEAEIHFSDDPRRLMVQLRSRIPVVGSISLHLRSVSQGRPLRAFRPGTSGVEP
jgi:hypothetical protein